MPTGNGHGPSPKGVSDTGDAGIIFGAQRELVRERMGRVAHKTICLCFTTIVHVGVAALLVHQWAFSAPSIPIDPPRLTVVDLPPLPPSPPDPVPQPVQSEASRPAPHFVSTAPKAPVAPQDQPLARVEEASHVTEPEPAPFADVSPHASLPPLPSTAKEGQATFEGMLLARLEQFRRYPEDALRRRREGVTYLRFRMNREGQVVDASIFRRSGCEALDREALATLQRAQPLPRIPDNRPDIIEVRVPIEFLLNRKPERLAGIQSTPSRTAAQSTMN